MLQSVAEKLAIFDIELYIDLFSTKKDLIILRSLNPGSDGFSFLCFDAFANFTAKDQNYFWNQEKIIVANPFEFLKEKLNEYKISLNPALPPLQGGAVGYFGYEANHYLEELPKVNDQIQLPDIYLNFYSTILAFDHEKKEAWIIATGFPEKDDGLRVAKARESIEDIRKIICHFSECENLFQDVQMEPCLRGDATKERRDEITSNLPQQNYIAAVEKTKEYILNGDIFQANITQQFKANLNEDPLKLYLKLMELNPAPFSAFIKISDFGYLISASPERFIKLTNRIVETCPIKGTQKRSSDKEEDQRLAQTLLNSEKDQAENTMIVDLMRNDLSRVCEADSVVVEELCALKTFATVHHLVSTITAKLKENLTAMDLLKATFPPGSVTGAPKIRAMEIISELEQTARGPYCGCIGYLSFNGNMDTSVTIRSFYINKQNIFFSAGGAIVLDSEAEKEYEESLLKAQALIKTLHQ